LLDRCIQPLADFSTIIGEAIESCGAAVANLYWRRSAICQAEFAPNTEAGLAVAAADDPP
jgi:hypothetical protein